MDRKTVLARWRKRAKGEREAGTRQKETEITKNGERECKFSTQNHIGETTLKCPEKGEVGNSKTTRSGEIHRRRDVRRIACGGLSKQQKNTKPKISVKFGTKTEKREVWNQ
jgi:hypothetical protein